MKRVQIVIATLLAGTAMQTHAREKLDAKSAAPVAVIGTESLDENVDRLVDIGTLCGQNRGNPAYGVNATPGQMPEVHIRGFKSEYGSRYGAVLNGVVVRGSSAVTPDGRPLLPSKLQQIEILQSPQELKCEVLPDRNIAYAGGGLPSLPPPPDPSLEVQALPPDVKSGRSVPTAADIRAELDGLVALCRNGADAETNASRIKRYERLFGQWRELRAIRDDLRERLLTNDPDLNREDAINQLRKLDPAIDGVIFPSQLKCPPTPAELAQSASDPAILYKEYSMSAGAIYINERANLLSDFRQPPSGKQSEITLRPGLTADNGLRPVSDEQTGSYGQTNTKAGYDDAEVTLYIGGSLGHLDLGGQETGIGFQRTGPGTETFADTATTEFDSVTLAARLTYRLNDALNLYGGYAYSEGDARTEFAIPAGGATDVGFVYGETSPSGSTGLAIGNRGLTGFNESDFSFHEFKIGLSTPIASKDGFSAFASAFANVLLFDMDFDSKAESTVFGSVLEQSRDQSVSSTYLGIGGALGVKQQIAPGVALTGSAAGGIYYRDSDLYSMERNSCALCPPADQDFTLTFDESDSGAAFAGSVSAGLEFDVTPEVKFAVGADASYLSDTGKIINPSSGDQVLQGETTRLGTTDAWRWRATAGFKLRF
ncbi:outer membrane protein [Parasphingorhabdus sp.]|uniref:outer membrane protein n=1 Tax=Parasphingorhabdus sp. TaxID=2709688 RepID=UPI003A94D270